MAIGWNPSLGEAALFRRQWFYGYWVESFTGRSCSHSSSSVMLQMYWTSVSNVATFMVILLFTMLLPFPSVATYNGPYLHSLPPRIFLWILGLTDWIRLFFCILESCWSKPPCQSFKHSQGDSVFLPEWFLAPYPGSRWPGERKSLVSTVCACA